MLLHIQFAWVSRYKNMCYDQFLGLWIYNCVLIVKHVITFEKGSYGPQYQRAFPRKLAQRHFKKVEGDSTKNQYDEKGNQKRTWNTKIKKILLF